MTGAQIDSQETLGRLLGPPATSESRIGVLNAAKELFETAEKAGSIKEAPGMEIVRGAPGLSARPGDELIVARRTDTGAYTVTRTIGAPEIVIGWPNSQEAGSVSYEISAEADSLRVIGFSGIFGYLGSKRDRTAADGGMRTSFIGWSVDNLLDRYGMAVHLEETGPRLEILDEEKAKKAAARLAYINKAVAQCLRLDVMFLDQPSAASANWMPPKSTSTETPPLPLVEVDLINRQIVRNIPSTQAS